MTRTAEAEPQLHFPLGSMGAEEDAVVVTPECAGWRYAGLRVLDLAPGVERTVHTGRDEALLLPLKGSCEVHVDAQHFALEGRVNVFDRVTDFMYLPVESEVRILSARGGSFALPTARAERHFAAAYGAADSVLVEIRGAGRATRQLNNFFSPASGHADRLMAVEVITPAGNTSSYPPHKHDHATPGGETELEEIYYYRFERAEAFGFHRTYAADGSFDITATVRDGDVFLVPRGYHGPCSAMPGYDMYYLNVLAGPGAERSLAFSDDPAFAWIRPSWAAEELDQRLPMTSAAGRL